MEGQAEVNGVKLWYEVSGEGEPVVQIHGAGFGHFNFAPATPELSKQFKVVDFDMRGYGRSERPLQHYDMEVWADDVAGLLDALGIEAAHVHGTSMGGMIAIVFAGKYPQRTTSVVINCAAAKLGMAGRLTFKNWIDIARMDPDGPGSRILAELIAWPSTIAAIAHGSGSPPTTTARAPSTYITGLRKNVKLIAKRSRQPTVRSAAGIGSTPYSSTAGISGRCGA